MANRSITVVIPTLQRPADLTAAVRSVFEQTLLEKTDCTLLIVDNSPDASAETAIEELRGEAPRSLTFESVNEPSVGVANARNCAMRYVQSDLIAFLDDDQSAINEQWLEKLYQFHADFNTAVTFGPVKALLPSEYKEHRNYFEAFFSRTSLDPRGIVKEHFGAGNSLVDVSQLPDQTPLFDPAKNETGGEDDLLFLEMADSGCRFGWEPEAAVYERVPVLRAKLSYTLRRTFTYGQGPTFRAVKDRRYHALFFWVLIGFAMFLCYGVAAMFAFLLRLENRAMILDKAISGLGKVFFNSRLKFYGASAIQSFEEQV